MVAWSRRTRQVVIPRVSREIVIEIILVGRSVPVVRAPLGDNFNLGTGRIVEVSGLVCRVDLDFLDAVDWGRHRTGRRSANQDRKSTRLNSSHVEISYAVFCLKKKKKKTTY